MKAHGGVEVDLVTRLRRVVSFTLLTLNPGGNRIWYSLERRLCEPQNRHGLYGRSQNFAPAGIRAR
jgi:hypothetical protein